MRYKRGRRIKNAHQKARQQQMKKVPLALVTVTTLASAGGFLTAEPVLAADAKNQITTSKPDGAQGVTTDYLNFRTGASNSDSLIRVLPPGTNLTQLGTSGEWVNVKAADGQVGWIRGAWFHLLNSPPVHTGSGTQQGITTDYLNFRTGAGNDYSVIRVLPPNTTLTQLGTSGEWVNVKASDGQIGWIRGAWFQPLKTPPTSPTPPPAPSGGGTATQATQGTTTDYVNFRTGAGTDNAVECVLSPGTQVKMLSRQDKWIKGQLPDGRIGWLYEDYITTVSTTAQRITTYPSDPNFYEVHGGQLYHVFGTPSNRTASYQVGPAPSFLAEGNVYVRDQNHQFYRRDAAADVAVGSYTPSFESLDLRLAAPVTASDLNNFIQQNRPDGLLAGTGQFFLDAQREYGVSAQYLFAHAILESGWGTSQICRDKNNFFGYQAYDNSPYASAAYFQSIKDAVEWEAYFVRNSYLNTGGSWYGGSPSLDGMNVHYASDPLWAEKIAGIMNSILPYSASDYNGKSPSQSTASAPTGPLKEIDTQKLPSGTLGVTLQATDVYTMPASDASTRYAHANMGTQLQVQGMQTDRWYQVQYGGQTGFVPVDSVQLTNILQVNVSDSLNVRATPSTSGAIMGIVPNGTYLVANLDANGKPIASNGWNQISYNGQTCYVYSQFVQQVKSL